MARSAAADMRRRSSRRDRERLEQLAHFVGISKPAATGVDLFGALGCGFAQILGPDAELEAIEKHTLGYRPVGVCARCACRLRHNREIDMRSQSLQTGI